MLHVMETTLMRKGRKVYCSPILLCSFFLVFLCTSASIGAQSLGDAAKFVPPDTVLLVDIDNLSQLRQQFEKTSFYKLYKDPAMTPFVDDFKTKLQEKIHKLDNELIRVIANAEALPQGRVSVALILNEQTIDANEPPLLLLTQWGQVTEKIKEIVEKMVNKAVEDGAHRSNEDYRGVDIITIMFKPSKSLSYCFIDDSLIGTVNPEFLKFVIAQIKGAVSPTLADDTDYSATIKAIQLSTGEQIDIYINIKQLIKTIITKDTTGKTKATIVNTGLDNVVSIGYSIGLGDSAQTSGQTSFGKALLKVNGPKRGICKMLEMESTAFRPPRFIPNSVYSVSFVNLNIRNAFETLGNILNSFSPQLAAIMYMPLVPQSPQGEPPVQLKEDIIEHLGSQIVIAQSISDSAFQVDKKKTSKALFALAINNRNALEKSLSLLHSKVLAVNNPDARRQLLGYTIYLVNMPAAFSPFLPQPRRPMQIIGTPETSKMPKLAFTVTDTHLIFSTESAIEQVIRALSSSDTASVDSAQWFKRTRSIIPSVAGSATLENTADSIELLWSELRNSKKQTSKTKEKESTTQIGIGVRSNSPLPHLMFSQAGFNLFDFSLLPEFDEVRKYFGLSASYGLSRPDGFFFEFKYLNPYSDN